MVEQHLATTGDPVDRVLAGLAQACSGAGGATGKAVVGGSALAAVRVLDVGGGSGTRAVPLAVLGCSVTVVDASVNSLAILHRRAQDAGVADRVVGVQADADRLEAIAAPASVDLVLCHHLLEAVDDPAAVMGAVVRAVRPGGFVSILVAGRLGAVLGQTMAGRFETAQELLTGPDGRSGAADTLRRRFDVPSVRALIESVGLQVESVTGVGVLVGLVSGVIRQATPGGEAELATLEAAAAQHPELLTIAADLHVVARRPDAAG